MKQRIVCLDFEGTLSPELWPLIAEKTNVDELKLTTREHPSFPDLMTRRMATMNKHGIKLKDIEEIVKAAEPLDGAQDFLNRLRQREPKVVIASDLAEQLALPILGKLGNPLFFGHRFVTNDDGSFDHYQFRQDDPKRKLVDAYHSINMLVSAAGDSYNDIAMLQAADNSCLFRAPDKVREEFPQFPHTDNYDELFDQLTEGAEL